MLLLLVRTYSPIQVSYYLLVYVYLQNQLTEEAIELLKEMHATDAKFIINTFFSSSSLDIHLPHSRTDSDTICYLINHSYKKPHIYTNEAEVEAEDAFNALRKAFRSTHVSFPPFESYININKTSNE